MQNLPVKIVTVLLAALLLACGGKKQSDDKAKAESESSSAMQSKKEKGDLLTEEIVKKVLGLESSIKFEEYNALKSIGKKDERGEPIKPPTYRLTRIVGPSFSFDKPNADEIRERNNKAMEEKMKNILGGAGKKVGGVVQAAAEMESEEVVVSQIYASRGGKADYEAVLARNSGGMTVKANVDKQIATQKEKGADDATLKAMRDAATMNIDADTTIEPVAGVGEAAYWSAKHRYICVLHKDTVFQIKVDYKEGENKQKAIEIAQEVLKKM